jgi:hypothetical protein
MTPDEKPPSRKELVEDVAARLRAAGLDAVHDGETVTVHERPRTASGDGASTGRNVAVVLGATVGAAIAALFGVIALVGDRLFRKR